MSLKPSVPSLDDKLRDDLLEHVLLGLLAALDGGRPGRALRHDPRVELLQVFGVAAGNLEWINLVETEQSTNY